MRYVPYEALGNEPNIIVDGPANSHTLITLSHWPYSPTPSALREDLSAQIVFRYLDEPEWKVKADAVSNNHFDEDGLVSVYSMLNPEAARAPLATQLSDQESKGGRWLFEGVEQITPRLGLTGAEESQIAPQEFVKRIKTFLTSGDTYVS